MSELWVTNVYNQEGDGAPNLPKGAIVTGVVTATSFAGSGANLTGVTATDVGTLGNLNVTGVGTFGGNVTIGGTLTYEDVTNIDAVGIITARDDINIVNDNKKLKIGAGEDLQLTHDGTDSFINNSTGHLYIRSNTGIDITNANGSKNMIVCTNAGEVEIFHNNVKKIETTSGGMKVTGNQTNNIVAMGANDVDCSAGSYFTKTITGATTFTFSNVPTGVEFSFTMEVTLNGSNAITWPSSVKWNADTAPTLTDGKTQLFMFVTTNGGTRFRGSALVDYVN